MKTIHAFVLLSVLTGCVDQDPFGMSQTTLLPSYYLELFESGAFYLHGPLEDTAGGGIIGGTVQEIGWSETHIFAKRHANFRGDPDGWMIIDTVKKTISGPLDESEFRAAYPDVKTMNPRAAWKSKR